MIDYLTKPVPNEVAAKFIRSKPIVSRQVYDRMLPEVQALAFTISGVERYDVLQRVRDLTAELPRGGDWKKLKAGIAAELSPFLGNDKAANARAELILRHHGLQSYRASQWEQVQRNQDVYPYLKYISTRDSATRASHSALHGMVLPVDDPWWQTHMPPWEWGCRCQAIQVSQVQYDAQLEREKSLPLEERKILDDAARNRLNNEGRLITARRDPQSGRLGPPENFDVRAPRDKGARGPGTVENLRIPLEVLRDRYDADIWQAFEDWAKQTDVPLLQRTVWDWLENGADATTSAAAAGAAAGATVVVATGTAPVSAAFVVNTRLSEIRGSAKEAMAAIDSVHGDGVLPTSKIVSGRGNSLGYYTLNDNSIALKRTGQWRELTFAHETGHFLHHRALSAQGLYKIPTEMREVMNLIETSGAFTGLETRLSQVFGSQPRKYIKYMLQPHELWARAYAQYVAQRSGNALMLDQVQRARLNDQYRQWAADDFEPIAEAIDRMFIKLGWRK